ncbi:MAG: ABC transporter permease subunit [Planctomycetes bacterium]|nr:ABC transporter permease subunit [Planctomycetota bacterium]
MNRDRRPGFSALLVFEIRKFAARPMPWCLLAAIVGVTLLLGLIRRAEDTGGESYELFAHLIARTLPFTAFVAMILGSLAVNHEVGAGSMRALLLRPVRRREIVLAKALLLAVFALLSGLTALFAAWAFTATVSDFGAVMITIEGLEPREVIPAAEMAELTRKLGLATLLPLLTAACFGLLISVLLESEGSAVATAIVGYLAMQVLGTTLPGAEAWLFPNHLHTALGHLDELAGQVIAHLAEVRDLGPTSAACLVPLAEALLFVLVAVAVFEKRKLPC